MTEQDAKADALKRWHTLPGEGRSEMHQAA